MSTGAFLCSCADTCDIDLEAAREDVEDVDVAASSSLLCQDKIGAFEHVIDEYDLSELLVTCPEPKMQEKLRGVAEEHGVHPAEIEFVDQREGAVEADAYLLGLELDDLAPSYLDTGTPRTEP